MFVEETIWEPVIISAVFETNPVISGQTTVLRVMAVDVFGREQTELWYSNEIGSGEV